MAISFITLVAVIALFVTWYVVSLRRKREKAREILRWIQASLAGRGHVVGISWTAASRFRVPLRLTCGVFRRAWVLVEMRTQETPAHWLVQNQQPARGHHLPGRSGFSPNVLSADAEFPLVRAQQPESCN